MSQPAADFINSVSFCTIMLTATLCVRILWKGWKHNGFKW